MSIVKYFGEGTAKKFDVNQAIRDGGWPDPDKPVPKRGIKLKDRKSGELAVVVKITSDSFYGMYFVHFKGGGWLCLDHAINQYGPA